MNKVTIESENISDEKRLELEQAYSAFKDLELLNDLINNVSEYYPCREQAMLFTKLEEALMWMNRLRKVTCDNPFKEKPRAKNQEEAIQINERNNPKFVFKALSQSIEDDNKYQQIQNEMDKI